MTMTGRKAYAGILALSVSLAVGAASGQLEARELKFSTNVPDDNMFTRHSRLFAEKVAAKTNGDVKITVYSNSTLGNDRDVLEGMQVGTIEMAINSGGTLSNFAPEAGVFGLPFLFEDWDHLSRALRSGVVKEVNEKVVAKSNIRVLGWMQQGFRVLLTNKREINAIDDMRGLKIRLPQDKILIETFALLGAAPTVIPWTDVYVAMQTGVVDGMESTPPSIDSMKFQEVADHLALLNHQHTVIGILIAEPVWKSLSGSEQAAMREAADEVLEENFREARANAEAALDRIRQGVKTVSRPDTSKLRDAVRPMYEDFGKRTGTQAVIDKIINM